MDDILILTRTCKELCECIARMPSGSAEQDRLRRLFEKLADKLEGQIENMDSPKIATKRIKKAN